MMGCVKAAGRRRVLLLAKSAFLVVLVVPLVSDRLDSGRMRRWAAVLVMAVALSGQACGGGDSGGGGDKAACQALGDAGQEPVAASYPRLLKMDLSSEMRIALSELRDSTAGDTSEKEGKVATVCAQRGVTLIRL